MFPSNFKYLKNPLTTGPSIHLMLLVFFSTKTHDSTDTLRKRKRALIIFQMIWHMDHGKNNLAHLKTLSHLNIYYMVGQWSLHNHTGALDSQHQFSRMLNEERLRKHELSPMLTVHDDDAIARLERRKSCKRGDTKSMKSSLQRYLMVSWICQQLGCMGTPAFTLGADEDCIKLWLLLFSIGNN